MVRITPKEPEIIHAQIAQFASERVKSFTDKAYILRNLSDIAVAKSVGDVSTPITYEEYVDFMRDHHKEQHFETQDGRKEVFKNRAAILRAYDEFAPDIKSLLAAHGSDYVAGGQSVVYPLNHDGKDYMIRRPISLDWAPPAYMIDQHIAAAALTRGLPHFEQVVAASYEDGMTVAEKMPGRTFLNLSLEDVAAMTDTQLLELIKTIQEADRLGLEIDLNPENFLYDKDTGFGFIDLSTHSETANKDRSPTRVSELIGLVIHGLKLAPNTKWQQARSQSDYDDSRRLMSAIKEVTRRYKVIVLNQLDQKTAKEAAAVIGEIKDGSGVNRPLNR